MSFANPTPLHIGMTGTLAGKTYRVAGRVVMGMEDAGETYYWNEFNLVTDEGESVTLVHEQTESGVEWKLFTMFEPEFPMTAADAATKRVSDRLNLEDTDLLVTMVDESRVYHLEGTAPEGVEVGDVAHYFNAEGGNKILVVSWTGEEVEFFWGEDLSPDTVGNAFGVRAEMQGSGLARNFAGSFLEAEESNAGGSMSGAIMKIIAVILVVVICFAAYSGFRQKFRRASVARMSAPAAPLSLGSTGVFDGKTWSVRGHAVVEISQVGRLYERHEYQLSDAEGNRALLVCGWKFGDKNWILFTPRDPLNAPTPQQAASLCVGQPINFDGYTAPVSEIFQSVIQQAEPADLPDLKAGLRHFGLFAQSGATPVFAIWNENGIYFYRGKFVEAKDVMKAFGAKAGK